MNFINHKICKIECLNNYMKTLIFTTVVTLILSSCESIIEMDIPEEPPKLVINSFFNPDSTWKVSISKSQHILDNAELKNINDATVVIYNGSLAPETLSLSADGIYTSESGKPLVKTEYRIEANAPGYDMASSSDVIPEAIPIISVDTGSTIIDATKYTQLKVKFKDTPGTKNYYNLQLLARSYSYIYDQYYNLIDSMPYLEAISFSSRDVVFGSDEWFDSNGASFSDELFDGDLYSLILDIEKYFTLDEFSNGKYDKIYIRLKSTSAAYYSYATTFKKFKEVQGDPFAQPVQVFNNIDGGYGIFAGYSLATDSVNLK